MKEIIIRYWHCYEFMEYKHDEKFPYSKQKRNEIINNVLDNGYSVMLRNSSDRFLTIYLDSKGFK